MTRRVGIPPHNDPKRLAAIERITSIVVILSPDLRVALALLARHAPLYLTRGKWQARAMSHLDGVHPDAAYAFVKLGWARPRTRIRVCDDVEHHVPMLMLTDSGRMAADALAVLSSYRRIVAADAARMMGSLPGRAGRLPKVGAAE